MTKTLLAASILALTVGALPAFAAEEYQAGPAREITSGITTTDVGSAAYPAYAAPRLDPTTDTVLLSNASSATVQPLNSAPVAAFNGAQGSTY